MKLKVVTFEQAKALKKLGLPQEDIEAFHFYAKPRCRMYGIDEKGRPFPRKNNPKELYTLGEDAVGKSENAFIAPSMEIVCKWLRDEKNYHIMIGTYDSRIIEGSEESYMYVLYHIKPIKCLGSNKTVYNSYEEALSAGIDKAIEILQNK